MHLLICQADYDLIIIFAASILILNIKVPLSTMGQFATLKAHNSYKKILHTLGLIKDLQPKDGLQKLISILLIFDNQFNDGKQKSTFGINGHKRAPETKPYKTLLDVYHRFTQSYQGVIFSKFKEMAMLLSSMDQTQLSIPLFQKGTHKKILQKKQIKYLFSLMCLNLVPRQHYERPKDFNNSNDNFRHIFTYEQFKTCCIIYYLVYYFSDQQARFIIQRNNEKEKIKNIMDSKGSNKMSPLKIKQMGISIEQGVGYGKVDFANQYIGGGSLRTGCVQEQIMFSTHPQLYVTILLCQKLSDQESIVFVGFKKYLKCKGYGNMTQFDGLQTDLSYRNIDGVSNQTIIAIDAYNFKDCQQSQFRKQKIDREIIKAYSGFNSESVVGKIATGNWGCGVFKGDLGLKFMIQWIASSLAQKPIQYYPYDKQSYNFLTKHEKFFQIISKKDVFTIYSLVQMLSDKIVRMGNQHYYDPNTDIIALLKKYFDDTQTKNTSKLKNNNKKMINDNNLAYDKKFTKTTNIKESEIKNQKCHIFSCLFSCCLS